MSAVVFRLRCAIRRRWITAVVVTAIVAVVCAGVIAIAAGAQRTATAPDRYESQSGIATDVLVTQEAGGTPRTSEVAALPGVASADAATFMFAGFHENPDALVFSGTPVATGMQVVEGRAASPTNVHEFVATRNFVTQTGAQIGSSLELFTLTQEQVDVSGFDSDPEGPRIEVTLVGIVDGPVQLEEPSPVVFISAALLDNTDIGVALTLMAINLQPGVSLETLRSQLDTLPEGAGLSMETGPLISAEIRRAVQVQANGLWLLALAAALAAVAALGQLITRQVRPSQSERERLVAIGFTDGQILAEALGTALVPITAGSLIGAGLAIIPSRLFPIGFARTLEPDPGYAVQWKVLIVGATLSISAVALWTLAALAIRKSTTRSRLPSPLVEAVATNATPSAAAGVRFALGRRADGRGSVTAAVAGVVLSIAGVVGAVTFGVSLDRLVAQPFRYGGNYDVAIGDDGAGALPEGLVERLSDNPEVRSLVLYAASVARVGDRSVAVVGMDVVRGAGTPYVVDGRLPTSADEIALGQVTARHLAKGIDDELELAGITQTASFRVTGLIVVPGLGSNDGLGDGGLVTSAGLARIDATAQSLQAVLQLNVGLTEFAASEPELAGLPEYSRFTPSAIINVARVRAIPFILAGVLAVLALITLAHVLLTAIRGCRRDRAVLCALGADRGWLRRSVHWQGTTFMVIPLLLGVPIGVLVGRQVFSRFAANTGAVADAAVPLAIIGLGVVASFIIANATVAFPARRASRAEPGPLLRSE